MANINFRVPYIFTGISLSFSNDDYLKVFSNFDDTKYGDAGKSKKLFIFKDN